MVLGRRRIRQCAITATVLGRSAASPNTGFERAEQPSSPPGPNDFRASGVEAVRGDAWRRWLGVTNVFRPEYDLSPNLANFSSSNLSFLGLREGDRGEWF